MIGRHGGPAFAFGLPGRIIDLHEEIDIATLRFDAAEVAAIGRAERVPVGLAATLGRRATL